MICEERRSKSGANAFRRRRILVQDREAMQRPQRAAVGNRLISRIGVRGEHLSGNQRYLDLGGDDYGGLATGTLTLRIKPAEFLVISLEGRGEWATREIYFSRAATTDDMTGELVANKKQNYAAIIGMTAYIGN